MSKEELAREFRDRYGREAEYFFFCPGRVNLIGEHIDYNGGKVMPCAIEQGTYLALARNLDKKFRFQCLNFPETAELQLQSSYSKTGKAWFNYPLGVINEIMQREERVSGLDLFYYGDIPIGAGLSSSASIEVLTGFAFVRVFNLSIPLPEIALFSQHAENSFIGVNCGIMDQFAVAMGRKDQAILLDCDSLEHEYLPFDTGAFSLVVINTNKPRALADSKYNERFTECGAALKLLKKEASIRNLCDLDPAAFEKHKHLIKDPVLLRRALHVVTENSRVRDATTALQIRDLETFGKLMYHSHASLRDDYEVSCLELDTVVDFCKTWSGCAGARMTGAGFGGCAIALINRKTLDGFRTQLSAHYEKATGRKAGIFPTAASAGVRAI